METVRSVAEKAGLSYYLLAFHIRNHRKELISRGVLRVEKKLIRERYLIPVSPEKFIKVLKEVIQEKAKGRNK